MRMTLLVLLLATPAFANSPPLCVETPKDRWDITPACSDYELDDLLIDAVGHDDPSAVALLEQRHDTVLTFGERRRIAEALLGHASDDRKYWNELYTEAQRVLLPEDELRAYSKRAGAAEDDYRFFVRGALWSIANDARSHQLMLRALSSNDQEVLIAAVNALGWQHDLEALDAVTKTLLRLDPEHRSRLAFHLNAFDSDAADAIAMRYLPPIDVADYQAARGNVHEYHRAPI
jgi:hypothetical protein